MPASFDVGIFYAISATLITQLIVFPYVSALPSPCLLLQINISLIIEIKP